MPGDQVDIEEQQRLEEQKNFKNTLEGIRQKNASQAELVRAAKKKAAKLIAEADALDKKAEELRGGLTEGKLTSYETLEGALLECVNYLEKWTKANNNRYIASWYNDPKWGPRLIKASDFVNICLDPKNIPHAIQAAVEEIAKKTGLPKKYYGSKYGVEDKQTPQQLYFDYKFDDGKVTLDLENAKADPFKLLEKDPSLAEKFRELNVQDNLENIMEIFLHAKGFDKNPADKKYYKVGSDGNLTEEVITEEQFKDVVGILKSNFASEDNQALVQFKEDTGVDFEPHPNTP